MTLLETLNVCNEVKIHSVEDAIFQSFGRILNGYDMSGITEYMENATDIPKEGNVYVPSVEDMEGFPVIKEIQASVYGGMPIQAGYCNGRNSTYNGFEYHKGSEINLAVTDLMLVLGHSYDIRQNRYHVDQATVFFVPKGTMIEMYQTTLHLSPLRVREEGFKGLVILPRGTNTPFTEEEKRLALSAEDMESRLLLQRNKWVIAHPDREPLIRQGAWPGVEGENRELFYPKE